MTTINGTIPTGIAAQMALYIVEAATTMAVLALFMMEESMQGILLAAFCMDVSGLKSYTPRYIAAVEEDIIEKMGGTQENCYKLAPFARLAFESFFKNAELALEAYKR